MVERASTTSERVLFISTEAAQRFAAPDIAVLEQRAKARVLATALWVSAIQRAHLHEIVSANSEGQKQCCADRGGPLKMVGPRRRQELLRDKPTGVVRAAISHPRRGRELLRPRSGACASRPRQGGHASAQARIITAAWACGVRPAAEAFEAGLSGASRRWPMRQLRGCARGHQHGRQGSSDVFQRRSDKRILFWPIELERVIGAVRTGRACLSQTAGATIAVHNGQDRLSDVVERLGRPRTYTSTGDRVGKGCRKTTPAIPAGIAS